EVATGVAPTEQPAPIVQTETPQAQVGQPQNVDWLDAHAGAAQAVAAGVTVIVTIVLVAITIYYAVETHKQVVTAQDMMAAQFRPLLVPLPAEAAYLQVPEVNSTINQG